MFKSVDDIKDFQKKLKPASDSLIYYYLNTIFHNLLIREDTPNNDINEFNNKNLFANTQKQKANEKGISFRNFLQYFDIQEFMCERIFNNMDKSKTGKLAKNEFVNGLYTLFFGSIPELYKICFFICDFNQENKIHKFNMKLILSYIPVNTYEEQQNYIKNINKIIDNYFSYLDKEYPEKNLKIDKEIDFDLYEKSIKDYINDDNKKDTDNFNNNGSFLMFINLVSYIYLNHPFHTDNINYCNFIKNKFLMKIPRNKNNPQNLEKNNNNGSKASSSITGSDSSNNNTNDNKKNNTNNIKNQNSNNSEVNEKDKDKNRSNSFHNSKKLKTNNNEKNEEKTKNRASEEELKNFKNSCINDNNREFHLSDNKLHKINNLLKSENFKDKIKEKKVAVGPFGYSPQKKQKKVKVSYASEKNSDDLIYSTEKEKSNKDNNNSHNSNIIINKKEEEEFAETLFKYCEEDNSKYIKKYYAMINGKEILFFTSKLKNELCSIWTISKTIIIPENKTSINRYTFYPLKFINYNNSFCLLYFEEQEKQKLFAKKCEEMTNFEKIEDSFEFKEKIGEGHFGVVKKCIEKKTGKEYAVKIMNKNKIKEKDLYFLIQERNYMCLVKHPNIVSLIRDFEDEKCLYFVMEYYKGGALSKYIKNSTKKNEKNQEKIAAKIIKIIAQGVEYLNQFGIVHRDLKPDNIVFAEENDIKSIKIIDLGVAITLPYGKQSSDPIGTLEYISPEMYKHSPYSYKVDVWSIGIILYYLASGGAVPFDDPKMDESVMGKKIVFTHQEYPEKYFGDKSKALITLIDKTLEKKKKKRINIHNFLKEEWLVKYS